MTSLPPTQLGCNGIRQQIQDDMTQALCAVIWGIKRWRFICQSNPVQAVFAKLVFQRRPLFAVPIQAGLDSGYKLLSELFGLCSRERHQAMRHHVLLPARNQFVTHFVQFKFLQQSLKMIECRRLRPLLDTG